jgi:hypothetical protein
MDLGPRFILLYVERRRTLARGQGREIRISIIIALPMLIVIMLIYGSNSVCHLLLRNTG